MPTPTPREALAAFRLLKRYAPNAPNGETHHVGLHIFHCARCGTWTTAKRSDALYCSNACRQKAYRDRTPRRVSFV